eukprot:8076915-Pyramimonas_sp.AAC.1
MYRSPRRLAWQQATSYAVTVSQGVLPGCKFAMALVQLLMLASMDDFVSAVGLDIPARLGFSFSLDIFADDLTLQVVARRTDICRIATDAVALPCDTLLILGLPVAKSKAFLTTSDDSTAPAVARFLRKYGFQAQS